jgi:heterodisulfide reductase subunit B
MKLAMYPGCFMQTEQYLCEMSLRSILPVLDVELLDLKNLSCCGEPFKSVNQLVTIYLSARNIAIAEQSGLDLFAPCPGCNLSLCECKHVLNNNPEMKERINASLASENLRYEGSITIMQTLELLYDHIGIETIMQHVKRPIKNIKMALHYGCKIIRPSEIGRPVDSENPRKMDEILNAIGIETPDYPERLDCCGATLLSNLPEIPLTKTGQKLKAIQEQGFHAMVTECPWCHKMYDAKQSRAGEAVGTQLHVPVIYLSQLLGIAFGLDPEKLGFRLNLSPVNEVLPHLLGGNA